MRPWSQEVVAWLTQVKPEEVASSGRQGRCRQLRCFAAWVRLGAIFEADPSQVNQLIQLAFQLTTNDDEGMSDGVVWQHHVLVSPTCSCPSQGRDGS